MSSVTIPDPLRATGRSCSCSQRQPRRLHQPSHPRQPPLPTLPPQRRSPNAPPGLTANRAGRCAARPWPRPTRWPRRPAPTSCAPVAAPSTRPWRCKWCSRWLSPSPAASAAAPSCCTTTANGFRPSTAAKPRQPPPTNACSWAPTANPWPSWKRWSVGARWACLAPWPCWPMAHRQHGKLPWAQLFEPAIELAENGFEVSPRLYGLLKAETALQKDPVAAAYFYQADGQPHPVGHLLKNPELAAVLRRHRAGRTQRLVPGHGGAGHRRQGAASTPTNPGPPDTGRPGALPARRTQRPVPCLHATRAAAGTPRRMEPVRLPAAEFGRARHRSDPGRARPCARRRRTTGRRRPAHPRLSARLHRSFAPGLCRPRAVCRRSRFCDTTRRPLDQPARCALPGRARPPDSAQPACPMPRRDRPKAP